MAKYLNVNVSGVQTPLKISDVMTIVANAAGTATVLTYAGSGQTTINIAVASPTSRPPSTPTQRALWVRGLWEQVIKGVARPWNLPMVPSETVTWDFTASPSTPVVPAAGARSYISQSANPAGSASFASKQPVGLLGTGTGAGALGAVGPIFSIT
tara:strand:- start:32 stop:496 length:465 start_codon:yes stop_codon:yes gene_type:complete